MAEPRSSIARRVTPSAVLLALAACSGEPVTREPEAPPRRAAAPPAPEVPVADLPPPSLPAPAILCAIGDVHGDLEALHAALRLCEVFDGARWSGGERWVVQVGDLLDRGDDEDEILALLERLGPEAEAAGGRLVVLNGNHELMNAQGDFRYVTPEGFSDFGSYAAGRTPRGVPRGEAGRAAAFAPGGPIARRFAAHPTAIRIGDTVFVHGGLSPAAAELGLARINRDMRGYLLEGGPLPGSLAGEESPVWHRGFAMEVDEAGCAALGEALARVGARRMVVGHTVQEHGITSACDERVWRIDVGLSRYYGGPREVLVIEGGAFSVRR